MKYRNAKRKRWERFSTLFGRLKRLIEVEVEVPIKPSPNGRTELIAKQKKGRSKNPRPCVLCDDKGCNVVATMILCDPHYFAYVDEAELGLAITERPLMSRMIKAAETRSRHKWVKALQDDPELGEVVEWG